MAVKIRLKRMGKLRAPHYRVVVADSRTKRDGRVIEEIGKYHPKEDPSLIEVDSARAQYWLGVGAQPSEPVLALLKLTGDWQRHQGDADAQSTVRVAETARGKSERFAEAVKDAHDEPATEAVTRSSRGSRSANRADQPAAEPPPAVTGADAGAESQAPVDEAAGGDAAADGAGDGASGA